MTRIQVRRLPIDPGPAAWNEILPPPPPATLLGAEERADWLVIGAGVAGLSAARRLTQLRPDERVVVLDAVRVGAGPAGRNSGFMIDLPHDLSTAGYAGSLDADRRAIDLNRAAIRFAADMASDYKLTAEAFEISGRINAAATRRGLAHNAEYAAHLDRLDEPYIFRDAGEMRALSGSPYFLGGLWTPGAAILQPALYMRGVADGLRRAGVAIYENSPVTELERRGGAWRAGTTGGAVIAPRVVLAVNGHAESFGWFRRRLMHVFTYGSMTRALTPEEIARLGGAPRWAVTPADAMGTTVRRVSGTGGDRIIVRNRFTYDPSMEISQARIDRVAREHDAAFAARFPMLVDVRMEYRWAGRLCVARNGVSAFGELEEGLFVACCQNGLGLARGTLTGMCAVELATGAPSESAKALLAEAAPSRLPPEPIAWLGVNAAMRWMEWRAGGEK